MTTPVTHHHFIGGKPYPSQTTEWRDVTNPATQEVVARVPFATREEVNLAVANAQEAFQSWRATSLTVPCVGTTSPARMCSSVDLPQPDGPDSSQASPGPACHAGTATAVSAP